MPKLTKCPVCGKRYLSRSIRLHIINSAKGEVYKYAKETIFSEKPKLERFNIKKLLHFEYFTKNQKVVKKLS